MRAPLHAPRHRCAQAIRPRAAAASLLLASLLLMICGCPPAPELRQLALPAALQSDALLALSPPLGQIQDEVRFGRFHALAVKRGPVLRDGAEWLTLGRRTDVFQETSFSLAEDGRAEARAVTCRAALKTPLADGTQTDNRALVLPASALEGSPPLSPDPSAAPQPAAQIALLDCSFLLSAESLASARLHLKDGAGTLELPRAKLRVAPGLAQPPQSGAVGSVLSLDGVPVAAAQWADQGGVWLAGDLPSETAAAAAATAAALLLVPGLR